MKSSVWHPARLVDVSCHTHQRPAGLTLHSLLARVTMPDLMFSGGLNPTLTQALAELAVNVPSILPNIQEKLMDQLSMVLAGKPFHHPGNRIRKSVNMQTSPSLVAQPVLFLFCSAPITCSATDPSVPLLVD